MTVDRSMVNRIFTILDQCLESTGPVPLAELWVASGLPKATTWRIAESLVEKGLLARTSDGYSAGVGVFDRGDRAAHQAALRVFVVPELVELHRQTGAAAWAVDVSRDHDWIVIAQIYDRTAMRNRYSDKWQHDPTSPAILATSLGHIGLAERPDLVEELLTRGVPRLTPNTQVAPRRVLATLRQASNDRQLIEHGQVWLGWSCLAVPILDPGGRRTVGVLGVMDRTPRFVGSRIARAAQVAADHLCVQWPPLQPQR